MQLSRMKNAFAVSTNTYHGFSLDEALRGIAAAGFRYVELTAVRGWTEHAAADMPDERIFAIARQCKELGLKPIGLSGHCNLMDEARLADFQANIGLAAKFGCSHIVTSTGEAHFGHDSGQAEDLLIANINKVLPLCQLLGITMVLETHGEYGTGASLARIVQAVGSPFLGINYDTANVVFYGKVLPDEEIGPCLPDIEYIHLKDKAGAQGEWNFPAVGKGDLRLDSVLDQVAKADNGCPISIEIEFTPAGPANVAEVDKAVADSFAYLKGLGVL